MSCCADWKGMSEQLYSNIDSLLQRFLNPKPVRLKCPMTLYLGFSDAKNVEESDQVGEVSGICNAGVCWSFSIVLSTNIPKMDQPALVL